MEKIKSTDDLFVCAINVEGIARDSYCRLAQIFSHIPEVSLFWKKMADDEDFHCRELQNIRTGLTVEQLRKPIAEETAAMMRAELDNISGQLNINGIVTLDDALELAYKLESSEVNTLFQVIIREFVSSEDRAKFVLSLVRDHVSRLEELSKMVPSEEERRKLLALHKGKTCP